MRDIPSWIRLKLSYMTMPKRRLRLRQVALSDGVLCVAANEDVGRQLYWLGRYEREETKLLQETIRQGDVCVDIGASIGYFTLLLARLAKAGAVHAFEPEPLSYALLQLNTRLNQLDNVRLNEWAVSETCGESSFIVADDRAFSSLRDTGRKDVQGVLRVRTITLDQYVDTAPVERVDFLKIDVEGAEGLVLDGAASLLADRARRPRLIMVELYEPNHAVFEDSIERIVARLQRRGYAPFVVANNCRVAYSRLRHNRYTNVFFESVE